jgi:hypothetical protein
MFLIQGVWDERKANKKTNLHSNLKKKKKRQQLQKWKKLNKNKVKKINHYKIIII